MIRLLIFRGHIQTTDCDKFQFASLNVSLGQIFVHVVNHKVESLWEEFETKMYIHEPVYHLAPQILIDIDRFLTIISYHRGLLAPNVFENLCKVFWNAFVTLNNCFRESICLGMIDILTCLFVFIIDHG